MAKILLVDDNVNLLAALKLELEKAGHHVEAVRDGEAAINAACQSSYDLVILDLGLPKVEGYGVCRRIRKSGLKTPILILSEKASATAKIDGLDIGADDYMTKPFDSGELKARVRALLRRVEGDGKRPLILLGATEVDLESGEVRRGGEATSLTAKEIMIFETLYDGAGRIFTRDQLIDRISGQDAAVTPRSIDWHILNLREAIEDNPAKPVYILTVRSLGYRLKLPNAKLTQP